MLTYSYRSPRRSVTSVAATLQKKEYGTASTIQTKLAVGQPNDQYEQEADRVADQVVNIPASQTQNLQRKCSTCENEERAQGSPLLQKTEEEEPQMKPAIMKAEEEEAQPKLQMQEEEEPQAKLQKQEEEEPQAKLQVQEEEEPQAKEEEEVQAQEEEEQVQTKKNDNSSRVAPLSVSRKIQERKGNGSPLPSSVRSFMESRMGADFSSVRVHTDSHAHQLNTRLNAQAFAVGNNVFFNKGKYNPDTRSGKHLLAHELTHTIQQKASPIVPKIQCQQMTYNQMLVARARARLAVLNQFVNEWHIRKIRMIRISQDHKKLMADRYQMDDKGSGMVHPTLILNTEKTRIRGVNKKALQIELTANAVRFKVQFQVRFEDTTLSGTAKNKLYASLKSNFAKGLGIVWNQNRLKGTHFAGRKFEVIPSFQMVAAKHKRDHNYWLITVRSSNTGGSYNGKSLGITGTVPTSAADSALDGGVMSIPPAHITKPGVLGHELLHLFGLVDRYMNVQSQNPQTGKMVNQNHPTRATGGRKDPLGAEDGTILKEDLSMLFEHLGVHNMEANRGLNTLQKLERTERMTLGRAQVEIARQQSIIKHGRDPHSLIKPRKNFNDKMLDSARNL